MRDGGDSRDTLSDETPSATGHHPLHDRHAPRNPPAGGGHNDSLFPPEETGLSNSYQEEPLFPDDNETIKIAEDKDSSFSDYSSLYPSRVYGNEQRYDRFNDNECL